MTQSEKSLRHKFDPGRVCAECEGQDVAMEMSDSPTAPNRRFFGMTNYDEGGFHCEPVRQDYRLAQRGPGMVLSPLGNRPGETIVIDQEHLQRIDPEVSEYWMSRDMGSQVTFDGFKNLLRWPFRNQLFGNWDLRGYLFTEGEADENRLAIETSGMAAVELLSMREIRKTDEILQKMGMPHKYYSMLSGDLSIY